MDITKPGKLAFDQKQNQIFYDKDNVNIALEKKEAKKKSTHCFQLNSTIFIAIIFKSLKSKYNNSKKFT